MSKKPHNKNISKVYAYYESTLSNMRNKIVELENIVKEQKEKLRTASAEYNLAVTGEEKDMATARICNAKHALEDAKQLFSTYTDEYKKTKQMYKTIQRAIEERWHDGASAGFEAGVEWTVKAVFYSEINYADINSL